MNLKIQTKNMSKGVLIALILCFSLLILITPAKALTWTSDLGDILDDSYTDLGNPNTNYGSDNYIYAWSNTTHKWKTIYAKFDIRDINANWTILNATAVLYTTAYSGSAPAYIRVFEVYNNSWDENSIIWNNQMCGKGAYPPLLNCSQTYLDSVSWAKTDVYIGWNVTQAVINNSGQSNMSLHWHMDNPTSQKSRTFATKEFTAGLYKPMLIVEYITETPVYSCQNITEQGNYRLMNNIYADRNPCFLINTSNVWFDLNGYNITGNSSDRTAIGIQATTLTPTYLNNISVFNGTIQRFINSDGLGAILLSHTNDTAFYDLVLRENRYGMYIVDSAYDDNSYVDIFDTNFTYNFYGIYTGNGERIRIDNCSFHSLIQEINALSLEESSINKSSFGEEVAPANCTILEKTFFFEIGNTTICTVWGTYSGATYGILCDYCVNNTFFNNIIFADISDFRIEYGYRNMFYFNQFLRKQTTFNGLYLAEDTYDNYGCGNNGIISDYGTNNIFEDECIGDMPEFPCQAGYFCSDDTHRVLVETDCDIVNTTECEYYCVSDGNNSYCGGLAEEEAMEDTMIDMPFPEAGWVGLLFTPFSIINMFLIGIGAYFEQQIKSKGAVFLVIFTVGSLAFTVLGLFPAWYGVVMILIGAGILTKFVLKLW